MNIQIIPRFILLILFLLPLEANAHKLLIDYTLQRNGIFVESFFPDGKPARDILIRMKDGNGIVLKQGTTDKKGGYFFSVDEGANYLMEADAGLGHFTTLEISSSAWENATFLNDPVGGQSESEKETSQQVSKIKKEPLPVIKILFGFGIIAAIAYVSRYVLKRREGAS